MLENILRSSKKIILKNIERNVGILSAIIYKIANKDFDYFHKPLITALLLCISSLIGTLLIPAVIAFIITYIYKEANFGKTFGYLCILIFTLFYLSLHY
jgi:hypothetical protein